MDAANLVMIVIFFAGVVCFVVGVNGQVECLQERVDYLERELRDEQERE